MLEPPNLLNELVSPSRHNTFATKADSIVGMRLWQEYFVQPEPDKRCTHCQPLLLTQGPMFLAEIERRKQASLTGFSRRRNQFNPGIAAWSFDHPVRPIEN
jgi:hypothetical protein